ncbi:MAG: GNAT family N-acetyltransferase [Patescibacteria group bacterium]
MEIDLSSNEALWLRRLSAGDVLLYIARNRLISDKEPVTREFSIRPFQSRDDAAVLYLHRAALQAIGAWTKSGPWDSDLEDIEQSYTRSGGAFLVGTINDCVVVAMGAFRRTSPERAEIKRMRVLPMRQGRGYGQAVLTALEDEIRRRGYRAIHLNTTILQVAAQKLYLKNGYREVGRITQGVPWETIFYEKDSAAL